MVREGKCVRGSSERIWKKQKESKQEKLALFELRPRSHNKAKEASQVIGEVEREMPESCLWDSVAAAAKTAEKVRGIRA